MAPTREAIQSADHLDNVRLTYLGLRLSMVLILGLLVGSVVVQIVADETFCQSISAFYYTPVKPVFVGMLCALGAALVVYRGSTDVENVLLDVCGVSAFLVALVPTDPDGVCPATPDLTDDIRNNALMLLGTAVIAAVWAIASLWKDPKFQLKLRIARLSSVALLVILGWWLLADSDSFVGSMHLVSASTLCVGIIAVIVINALQHHTLKGGVDGGPVDPTNAKRVRVLADRYAIVAIITVLCALGFALAGWRGFGHWIFWLELTLVGGFLVHWVLQTYELRGFIDRADAVSVGPTSKSAR